MQGVENTGVEMRVFYGNFKTIDVELKWVHEIVGKLRRPIPNDSITTKDLWMRFVSTQNGTLQNYKSMNDLCKRLVNSYPLWTELDVIRNFNYL